MIGTTIETQGTLEPDSRLILDDRPDLPPGRVRVSLQPLTDAQPTTERLPDAPWLDDSISAPVDLPRVGIIIRVQPRAYPERLPELPTALTQDGK